MKKEIVLSGVRPTGRLHVGHYWGVFTKWLELQEKYECFFVIVDWHSLTTAYEKTAGIKDSIKDMVIDWLALGLDPEKCCIFKQSDVKEHAELALLLGMITPVSWLLRNPTYKEQLLELYRQKYAGQKAQFSAGKTAKALAETLSGADEEELAAQSEISTHGFLGYPVLQAADILLYRAGYVPVGQDQLAHLELTRDIARRFSDIYGGGVLIEPKSLVTASAKIPGIDGRKMSKSYGNSIALGEDVKSLEAKIRQMYTDASKIRLNDKGHPEGCVVFAFHRLYNPGYAARENQCKNGEIGCSACKNELFKFMAKSAVEFNDRRKKYEDNEKLADSILEKGAQKARNTAPVVMESVRKAMGI